MLEIFFIAITSAYVLAVLVLLHGWASSSTIPLSMNGSSVFITVVIAARNEEANIAKLVQALRHQSYSKFEVVIVDDHSEDSTWGEILRHESWDRLRLIRNVGSGKKQALKLGIESAQGDIVVTTDADCIMGPNWLSGYSNVFANDTIHFAFGPVAFHKERNVFEKMQTLEFASLIGSGAASAYFNQPSMCNGANLGFRKKAFMDVGGYDGNDSVPSGDDEFLMHKITLNVPGGVRFIKNNKMIVETAPCKSLKEFWNQRVRWASKWKNYNNISSSALAVLVLLFHLFFISIGFLWLAGFLSWEVLAICWGLKAISELFFLSSVLRFLNRKFRWGSFMLLQFVHSIYVVVVGVAGILVNYNWKNRIVRNG